MAAAGIATVKVVDMHTGGEPVRIVTEGYPPIPGATILEKRSWTRQNADHLRRLVVFEPRGHFDMYGVIPVQTSLPEADLAVLFMHNEGYSTMCGHAVIALGRYAVDQGIVPALEPVTTVKIECPCGLVTASVAVNDGKAGAVSFESVPAFLLAGEQTITVASGRTIRFDISYGGAFYALADCRQWGLEFGVSRVRDLVDAATELSDAVKAQFEITHPDADDLGFLYGSILTDGGDGRDQPTRNICVFADAEVDRSPTGSGVTARLAALYAKGAIALGEERTFESITGSQFRGSVVRQTMTGPHNAIVARVSGQAFYCGTAEFVLEPADSLGKGFLLK